MDRSKPFWHRVRKHWDMYLMLLPALAFLILFKYLPMWGIRIAFQDYNIFDPAGSPWVGLENFQELISSKDFFTVLRNTLIISFYKIAILFPMGVVVALILNEVRSMWYKKTVQTIIYIPHFLSWIVVAGIFTSILSTTNGLVNPVSYTHLTLPTIA